MASISALSNKLDLLIKRIHSTFTGKLDVDAQAADSALLGGKAPAEVRADVVSIELAHVNGRPGEVVMFHQEGIPMAFKATQMLKLIRMASDTTTIDNLKAATVPFVDVFNSWKRISHGNNLVFPNLPAELTSWSYDSGTDRIVSTTNSASLIGFISNDRFDSYEFETILRSSYADDDGIGICAAFKQIGTREYTLSVLVDGGGLNEDTVINGQLPKLMVVVNYNQGVANGRVTLANIPLNIPAQAWNGVDLNPGVRLVIKRTLAGMLEVTCKRADGTAWPTPVQWTGAIPSIFKDACPIGYLALSQINATWENIKLPTAKTDIVDKRDTTVWKWNGSAWVNAGQYALDASVLQRGMFYKDTVAFASYYIDLEGDIFLLGSPGTLS